jgi:hypothetical protein
MASIAVISRIDFLIDGETLVRVGSKRSSGAWLRNWCSISSPSGG